jgi:hypothetical protein
MEIVLFFARLIELAAGSVALYAKNMPILVGSLIIVALLGCLVLGVLYLLESPAQRCRRRFYDAVRALNLQQDREQEILNRYRRW